MTKADFQYRQAHDDMRVVTKDGREVGPQLSKSDYFTVRNWLRDGGYDDLRWSLTPDAVKEILEEIEDLLCRKLP